MDLYITSFSSPVHLPNGVCDVIDGNDGPYVVWFWKIEALHNAWLYFVHGLPWAVLGWQALVVGWSYGIFVHQGRQNCWVHGYPVSLAALDVTLSFRLFVKRKKCMTCCFHTVQVMIHACASFASCSCPCFVEAVHALIKRPRSFNVCL